MSRSTGALPGAFLALLSLCAAIALAEAGTRAYYAYHERHPSGSIDLDGYEELDPRDLLDKGFYFCHPGNTKTALVVRLPEQSCYIPGDFGLKEYYRATVAVYRGNQKVPRPPQPR